MDQLYKQSYLMVIDADASSASSDIDAWVATPSTIRHSPAPNIQLLCRLSPGARVRGPGALVQLIAGPTLTHCPFTNCCSDNAGPGPHCRRYAVVVAVLRIVTSPRCEKSAETGSHPPTRQRPGTATVITTP